MHVKQQLQLRAAESEARAIELEEAQVRLELDRDEERANMTKTRAALHANVRFLRGKANATNAAHQQELQNMADADEKLADSTKEETSSVTEKLISPRMEWEWEWDWEWEWEL